jgi:ribosomal protein L16 Arg81 hydroxylase
MQPIIVQSAQVAHANPDVAARQRAGRLAKATVDQMQDALAFLSMIDPEAFDIAFTAVTPTTGDHLENDKAVPACRTCGTSVGIFPEHGLDWQHHRGDGITSGPQEIYDPGHAPEVTWCLPDENPEEF